MIWIGEIPLDEMLSDEIVLLVMRRDGVTEDQVRAAIRTAGRSASAPPRSQAAPDRG